MLQKLFPEISLTNEQFVCSVLIFVVSCLFLFVIGCILYMLAYGLFEHFYNDHSHIEEDDVRKMIKEELKTHYANCHSNPLKTQSSENKIKSTVLSGERNVKHENHSKSNRNQKV